MHVNQIRPNLEQKQGALTKLLMHQTLCILLMENLDDQQIGDFKFYKQELKNSVKHTQKLIEKEVSIFSKSFMNDEQFIGFNSFRSEFEDFMKDGFNQIKNAIKESINQQEND